MTRRKTEPRPTAATRTEILVLVVILLAGAGLRVAYLAEIRDDPGLANPPVDAGFNLYWARGLATGDWSLPPDADGRDPRIRSNAYIRAPGYPYVLAVLYRITGGSPLAIRALQMIAGLLAAGFAWWVGRRLVSRLAGILWAGFMAVHWAFIYFEAGINGTWVLTLLFLATVLVVRRLATSARWLDAAALGVLIGLTALVRSNALLLGPVLAPWLLIVCRRRRGARAAWGCLAAAAIAGALTLLPSTVRNARVSGHIVPVSANGGFTLYSGNNPDARGTSSEAAGDAGFFATPWHSTDVIARASERSGRPVDYVEASRLAGGEALRWMRENPTGVARLVAVRALLFCGPAELAHSSPVAADRQASPLLRRLPFPFALIAAAALWAPLARILGRRRSAIPAMTEPTRAVMAAVVLIVAGWFVSYLPFLVTSLYRMTVVPALLLIAAVGADATVKLARARQPSATALSCGALLGLWLVLRIPWIPVDPGWTERLTQRGLQWRARGDLVRAESELREALRSSPGSRRAANGLAAVLLDQRRFAEAAAVLEPAAAAGADDPGLYFNLGLARVGMDDWRGAETALRRATELAPNLVEAQMLLASSCEHTGDPAGAIAAYDRVLDLDPDRLEAANNLAWLLATTPDPDLRDGERAVTLARRTVKRLRVPASLDTLAAALAETGRFDEAVATLEEAIDDERRPHGPPPDALEARLALYRAGLPYRGD